MVPLEDDPLYITDEELEAHEAKLVAEGRMRLPKIEPTPEFWEEFFKEPLADFRDLDAVRFISEDRDEDDEDMARRYRMKTVSVKQLQDDLGRYLDEVRAGKEVIIEERNNPVAKIIPFKANGEVAPSGAKPTSKKKAGLRRTPPPLEEDPLYISDEELEAHVVRLAAEGKILLGKGPVPPEFFDEPLAQISTESLVPLISEDRDEE